MNKVTSLALAATVLVSGAAFEASAKSAKWEGEYACKGTDPVVGSYTGHVTITPNGETFKLDMAYDTGEKSSGVGIQNGKSLSVSYKNNEKNIVGTEFYIYQGDVIKGEWADLGSDKLGREECQKVESKKAEDK